MIQQENDRNEEIPDLKDPAYYIDRELSWLQFNGRVIEEALDHRNPLLERLKFIGIVSSNLDEFFMVRVSGIQEQVQLNVRTRNTAGATPSEQFELVHKRAQVQVQRIYKALLDGLIPDLNQERIYIRRFHELTDNQKVFLRDFFDREVFPVLTPLAVDSGHPFPHLRNLSLNLAVRLAPPPGQDNESPPLFAVMQVPNVLERFVRLPSEEVSYEFILLEELIAEEINLIFPGMKVLEVCAFRVTRDADIEFAEEEADDLLKTIEEELRQRERGSAVRLDVESKASPELTSLLRETIGLDDLQCYTVPGPINLVDVAAIGGAVDRPDLKYPGFVPAVREPFRSEKNIFRALTHQDVLIHHPYEAFSPVSDFVEQAAHDPNVLAIKQTLYRTSGDSAIVKALMNAAENGKQVAALMELKARFDEERNIGWAKQMEKAGVHVVYGLVGLKTHAKVCLVVRKEPGGIRRYVHLGTGNYNPITAGIYTDMGLLTCDPDLCDDASELFNLLTGYSRMPQWRKMIIAPTRMRDFFLEMIQREIDISNEGGRGLIRAKMNSLVDPGIIIKLYEASQAGVQVDLLVRGICCLRPGVENVSDNIRVFSIVGRFLEHSRIFMFGEGEDLRVYLGSADWMQRNLDRRVETIFPIEAQSLKDRIEKIWRTSMSDNLKRRVLRPDGEYERVERGPDEPEINSQEYLIERETALREEIVRTGMTPEMLVTASTPPQPPGSAAPIRPAQPAARSLPEPDSDEGEEEEAEMPPLLGEIFSPAPAAPPASEDPDKGK